MFFKTAFFLKYSTNKVNQSFIYNFYNYFAFYSPIDKDLVKQWKFIGKNSKIYDNELKSYIHTLNVGALSKMQIPINEKSSLNLMHGFITFQIYLNTTKSFTIEIAITDTNNGKKRILLSACSKEFIINQLHCRIPMINIPTNIWINFSIDILSFVGECFKGQSFRAIDNIILSADCKIRRICGMRQLYTLSAEEYLQGDDTLLPKGFILPNEIKHIDINFDMNYIKKTIDIKNIKNNNHLIKDKKTYPKTSQSKRETKLINTPNVHHNNNNANANGNRVIRTNIKSKSINKQKIKNNLENDLDRNTNINKNKYNLKEFVEVKKGSLKNLKNINGINININKNETMKKDHKNNFLINNKPKEKINSKSMGKAYIKNKNNNFINSNGKNNYNNNFNNNLKNEKNVKKTAELNIRKNNSHNIQQDKIINTGKNIHSNINDKKLNNFTNKQQSEKINKNKVVINNKNVLIPKEELNLFNTFNYKDLESKENTLLVNQSNFNNASIPEIVDLDNNNTYLKNIENDIKSININNDIIMIDNRNKNNENSIINHDQIDSIINEKFLYDINDNNNERPYTPPLQKIIPVNNENDATLNNVNITKINESIIQNHYCDLVYDKETGRYYDKKTKIFYDFK